MVAVVIGTFAGTVIAILLIEVWRMDRRHQAKKRRETKDG